MEELTRYGLSNDAGFMLSKVARRQKIRWAEMVAQLGLTTVEAALIRNLALMPGMSSRARAKYLAADPMSIHRSLESLIDKGFCEKKERSHKRYDISLTKEGEKVAIKVFAMSHEVWSEIEGVVGRDCMEALINSLIKVDNYLDSFGELPLVQ